MDLRPRAVAWLSPDIIAWQRQCLIDAGQDPSIVPDEPFRFLRLPEVVERVGLSVPTIYRKIADGKFPKSVRIDRGGVQRAA